MLPVTQMLITNPLKRPFRKLKQLKAIIIHWTANTNKGADAIANRNFFQNDHTDAAGKPLPPSSAHYNVDDLRIIQCVPDDEVAYHVGARWDKFTSHAKRLMGIDDNAPEPTIKDSPNNYTVGIEMCVNSDANPDLVWKNTVDLTKYLMERYKITGDNLLRHFDITGKDCPRFMVGAEEHNWIKFKNDLGVEKTTGQPVRMVVDVDTVLNVRNKPSKDAEAVRALNDNDTVEVAEIVNGWAKIGDNEFVYAKYLINT